MTITNINIRRILDNHRLKAIVSVTFDEMFVLYELKVIRGDDRYFLAMPSEWAVVDGYSTHRDLCHPVTLKFRQYLENEVLKAYHEALKKQNADAISINETNAALTIK